MRKSIFFLALVIVLAVPQSTLAYSSPGSATGFVNDFAQVLTAEESQSLEMQLRAFEASTTNEIAVVTISSLEGDSVENYAVKLFEDWKIGKEGRDNGILLLVAKDDREVRIEVGYGLEGAVPDAISNQIIQKEILPKFRDNDYHGGILAGVENLILASQNEYTGLSTRIALSSFSEEIFELVAVAVLAALTWIGSILARSKSWWLGGILGAAGGMGAWMFFGLSSIIGGVIVATLFSLGLLFDYVVSRSYRSHVATGTRVPWWAGGGGFGGGHSSGGFGGFGGGSSGGGGASGRW